MSELEVMIRARYPLLYVVTWEEERVLREVSRIGQRLGKKVYEWGINRGLTPIRQHKGGFMTEGKRETRDPILALTHIMAAQEGALFVLKDFHFYMKDSVVVRHLRDLAQALRHRYVSVIILSPTSEIPPELEKDLTILDFPLPGYSVLNELLDNIAADLHDNPRFRLDASTETREKLIEAARGLTLNEAENVFAKTLILAGKLTAEEIPLIYSEKKQIIRKSGLLEYIEAEERMEQVGGLHTLKDWLRKRRLAFSEKAREFGLPNPKGALFIGVQGCGKSLCAKAVASLWRMPLLRLDMGRMFSSFVGASEANIRRAISVAESLAPVILWVDEIEKGLAGVGESGSLDSGTTARVFGTLITWMQEKKEPVFVIGTANNVNILPPEVLRKGRFDEIFFIDLPTVSERAEIFSIHLARRRRDPARFDIARLAAETDGFSGSEIESSVVSALFDAFEAGRDIATEHIISAVKQTFPLSILMKEQIARLRDWAKGRARPAS
ncbi:MAG: AAA family ATPase [Candidatus Sumerlaeia bacterium]